MEMGAEAARRLLNPLVLNLQKMELELKCPSCLLLLDQPILLPCDHMICSYCITDKKSNCPSCKQSFLQKDLRPAVHIKAIVNIHKDMKSALCANLEANPIDQMKIGGTSLFGNTSARKQGEGNVERVIPGNKRCVNGVAEEVVADQVVQNSPPSFGNIKDSDHDSSNQEHRLKSSPVGKSCKRNLDAKELDIDESKRQKLNMEYNGEHNETSLPKIQHELDSTCLTPEIKTKCEFCHSARVSEATGQMLHYLNGKQMDANQATQPNVLHAHEKCIEWAPQVYYSDETVMNLESEIARASKIKCSRCGLKGAALGCYVTSCRRSYHVPCAYEIQDCRWDLENFMILCHAHSSRKLPCDRSKTKAKNKTCRALSCEQPKPKLKNTTNHALPFEQPKTKLEIRTNHSSSESASPTSITQQCPNTWSDPMNSSKSWVFCGSSLSREEKVHVYKLARLSGATVSDGWRDDVSHVIASTDEHGGCSRTVKFLMAILGGKWVVNMKWVKDCIQAGQAIPEESYEVAHDVHGCIDGPRRGRIRCAEKAPKLFDGLSFVFTGFFVPSYKGYLIDLILAAGGTHIKKGDQLISQESATYVIYSDEPPRDDPEDAKKVMRERREEAEVVATQFGASAVSHSCLLDAIAASKSQLAQ